MDNARPRAETAPVTLAYTLTAEDFASALRARQRRTPWGRATRLLTMVALVLFVIATAISLALGEGMPVPAPLTAGLVAGLTSLVWLPRLQARALQKATARHGRIEAVVDASGVRHSAEHGSSSMAWQLFGRYLETGDAFVLLSPDRAGTTLVILPKRAAEAPGETDRLRALLDAHLTRG
ncbi:YcxB family protein [Actinacidiphila glaucinigra]|uniref:YcxB family protein n=1 Tax=Actinacidiphila glaucinigra TaxID=235986 RepID=UPI00371BEEE9